MIGKIFSHLRLRYLNFTSQTIHLDLSNDERIELALTWFSKTLLPEGGSSAKYSMLFNKFFAAYPGSTAFWIHTLIDIEKNYNTIYKNVFGDDAVIDNLAQWLITVQRKDGTFPGSYGDFLNQPPRVFNNGQIILGLLHYYDYKKSERALLSAVASAEWLLKVQDADGAWRQFTLHQLSSNTRSAYGLLKLGNVTGDKRFTDAGLKNIEFALSLQKQNGYFKDNGFSSTEVPTTHTISYGMYGILAAAIELKNEAWIQKLSRSYENIAALTHDDGYLAGQINDSWHAEVNYCCLTGNCQLSKLGFVLYKHTGNKTFLETANKLLDYVKTKQLVSPSPYVNGGISGSWPVSGGYCAYDIPNWAARFYVEALMLQSEAEKN